MRILCLLLGVTLLGLLAPSTALPTTKEVLAEEGIRMEKSLTGKKDRMANPYEDDEFEEVSHGLMSDTGSSVKSYVVQHPEGEEMEEAEEKREKKSKKTKKQPVVEESEEEEEDELERKDTKKSEVKYQYDPEYLEQGYLLPVAVKGKGKDRKDAKKKKNTKYEEEESEEEAVQDDKKGSKKPQEEESEEGDEEEPEDEEEDDEPQGGPGGSKKEPEMPSELKQTLLNQYGFIPKLQGNGQGGQQGGPGGHQGGGGRPHGGGYGGGHGGPPPHHGGGGHGEGPDGPHYDFPPSRTPGAKPGQFGTPPPGGEQGYGPPPQNYGQNYGPPPNSQEQQPSTFGSLLSRLNPFKSSSQQEYGPNGPPQNGQYGGGPPNGQYGAPPNGQFNGPPPGYGHDGEDSGPPPRGPPPSRKNKKGNKYRKHNYDGPQDDYPQGPQGPSPYGQYEPEPSASEIRVKPLMSRLQSVFGMGGKSEQQQNDPFVSVRY